ncbi:armadillo-type protein [Mucor mucedo]|uniref:armadillo-type protein n=1 Tax=Mucor mucedo TaxID=29922 RepID=UPI00221F6484|nr:armadillo-type protein [Mucor mucedo]KAI7890041.1 armadillo-type protein [Mucor mucedo]
MDILRASSIVKALPFISKTIVDDTLYEKVLSYLTLVLSQSTDTDIQTLNEASPIFKHMKQACIDTQDQDYRVTTLCIRVLAQVIYYAPFLFTDLQENYASLLTLITNGIKSSEGALRRASIEACRLFIHCPQGYKWLLHNTQATRVIPLALLDQSNYVVAEACQLFAALLTLDAKELLEVMDPSSFIISILDPHCDDKQVISALEFCWVMVNIQQPNALIYLRTKKLLYGVMPLLCSVNRIIRYRVLEILSVLFSWDRDPLITLGLSDIESELDTTYEKMVFISNTMIQQAANADDLMTAVSLLDTTFVLLGRCKEKNTPFDTLYSIYEACQAGTPLLKTDRLKNNVLQLVLRSMHTLVRILPETIHDDRFIHFFRVLDNAVFYSDPRVLKSCLDLLTTSLYTMADPNVLAQSMYSLVHVLSDDSVLLGCKSLVIVLQALDSLLAHEAVGTLVNESSTSATLVDALSMRFLDTEWDVRDAVIHFVGGLFQEPVNDTKVQFACTFDLPLQVFSRIHDAEPYVRASAVQVLTNMVKCKGGWDYIQEHQVSKDLAGKLPSMLYDSEAFVRRAGLDAIICLVRNRSCAGMTMEIEDSQSETSLNPVIIKKLVYDEDSDVRIRACALIEALWRLNGGEHEEKNGFIRHIRGAELLVECATDVNRVVRIEAYRVIDSILSDYPAQEKGRKRKFEHKDEFTCQFLELLNTVDRVRLKDSLDPEHLYQEAFDINADMMTQSILPTNPEDDINMLDCY